MYVHNGKYNYFWLNLKFKNTFFFKHCITFYLPFSYQNQDFTSYTSCLNVFTTKYSSVFRYKSVNSFLKNLIFSEYLLWLWLFVRGKSVTGLQILGHIKCLVFNFNPVLFIKIFSQKLKICITLNCVVFYYYNLLITFVNCNIFL